MASAQSASPGPWASVLPWHIKVRPGSHFRGDAKATLSIARGECQGFQILATPPLRAVDARLAPPKGPGTKLSPRIYREDYVPVQIPSNGQGAVGLWPDPLIPVRDGYYGERRRALPFDSTPERPLVLYVETCVPAQQAPGKYQGALQLSAKDHASVELPLAVEVLPISIPATSSLPTTFGLSLYSVAKGHQLSPESPEARALLKLYATALLEHRLSPFGLSMEPPKPTFEGGKAKLDFRRYDAEVGPFLEGRVLASGARFTSAEVREGPKSLTDEERVLYYQAFRDHFRNKGWQAQLFYYAKDEPKPEDYPKVLAQSQRVRKAGGIPVLVTSPPDDRFLAAADIACPVVNCFFERSGPKTCSNIQTISELRKKLPPHGHVWWYQSCLSHGCSGGPLEDPRAERAYSGWASYMVDHPAMLNRAMGPLAFLTGVEGELYWDTTFAYQEKDPWQGVFAFGGNGDGTLFYPGIPSRIGGEHPIPIESLRLKYIRDGLQDYEYLKQVERVDSSLAHSIVRMVVQSGYEISLDPISWDAARAEMIRALKVRKQPPRS